MTIVTIGSSHGEFDADFATGEIKAARLFEEGGMCDADCDHCRRYLATIKRFDVQEWAYWLRSIGGDLTPDEEGKVYADILDVGYWYDEGEGQRFCPPEVQHREERYA